MAEPLTATEIVINDVTFQIRKMLPLEAFALLEVLRPALADTLGDDINDSADPMQLGFKMILGLPANIVAQTRATMFARVFFRGPQDSEWQVLSSNTEKAFKDLEAFHVYEMLVRCFAVNFSQSLAAFDSRLPVIAQAMRQSTQ